MNNPEARAIEVINPAAEGNPKVKLGDRVAFDALGRKAIGTVTRCDEDGITIREERWRPPRAARQALEAADATD